ncbi:MAG TPA: hypothetical protein VLF87_02615 [Patescibacteria group bacterium]|nr:hypothetical protein [Patescibacteria group bacterium]
MTMGHAVMTGHNKEIMGDFAVSLARLGMPICSYEGTADFLLDNRHLQVTEPSQYYPPEVAAAAALRPFKKERIARNLAASIVEDPEQLEALRIPRITLVCVDLAPIEKRSSKSPLQQVNDGGIDLLMAGVKANVLTVCDQERHDDVLDHLQPGRVISDAYIADLANRTVEVVTEHLVNSMLPTGLKASLQEVFERHE